MEQKKERLEDWAANRKEHMKGMPWSQKMKWYLTYYGVQTLAVVIAVGLAAYFLWSSTIGRKETWLNCVIINADADAETLNAIGEAFSETQELNTKKQLVTLDSSYLLDVDSDTMTQNNASYLTKLKTYFAAKEVDLIVAPKVTCDYLDGMEYYYQDLEKVMGSEFLDQFDESQLRYMEDENGETFICGVSLDGSKLLTETDMMIEDPYVMIPYTSVRADNAAAFLKYIFE